MNTFSFKDDSDNVLRQRAAQGRSAVVVRQIDELRSVLKRVEVSSQRTKFDRIIREKLSHIQ